MNEIPSIKKAFKVVAHKLRYLLRENEVATVVDSDLCTYIRVSIKGFELSFPINGEEDILKLYEAEKSLPVRSSSDDSILRGEAKEIIKPTIAEQKLAENPELGKLVNRTQPSPKFVPPTEPTKTTRSRITSKDIKGTELWSKFESLTPKPYAGKKKLTDDQRKDIVNWEKIRDIARSYLLANEYQVVQSWIELLKNNPAYYMEDLE